MSMQDTSATRALTVSDIDTTINHEPRIRDRRLAAYLGYADVDDLRALAKRHSDALLRFGEVSQHAARKPVADGISPHDAGKIGRGRPQRGQAYNKRQALYLCAKSEKPNATDLTIEMVEVFDAFTAGRPAPERPAPERPALPPPAEPPFCQGCAARVLWQSRPAAENQHHVLLDGPITRYELAQLVMFRGQVKKATQDLLDKALAAADTAARNTLKSLP